jgi:hypothetical protein
VVGAIPGRRENIEGTNGPGGTDGIFLLFRLFRQVRSFRILFLLFALKGRWILAGGRWSLKIKCTQAAPLDAFNFQRPSTAGD